MIKRLAEKTLKELSKDFKIVGIIGPRQSGKTTLSKIVFPKKKYVSLENPDLRLFAEEDPRGFLNQLHEGAIIDEIQYVPVLFSYLQEIVDNSKEMGRFVITGSQNFNMMERITQSLAGRIGLIQLLPFAYSELKNAAMASDSINEVLFKGAYPPIYDNPVAPERWYNSYINSYVERDVRQLVNVKDLSAFQRFLRLCAGYTGQLLNMSRIAADCGKNQQTISAWISILEASYIIYRLNPHYENFRKRLVKTPKLYFYDTGIAVRLLGIDSPDSLFAHSMRGAIFENWIVSELLKYRYNMSKNSNLYFWRNNIGDEIDVIVDNGNSLTPIEIKSGATISTDWFAQLNKWCELAGDKAVNPTLIYGGDMGQVRNRINVCSWKDIDDFIRK